MANQQLSEFADRDLRSFFVLWQDDRGRPPTREQCAAVRDRNGLTMPVLMDRSGQLSSVGLDNRHVHLVMRRGAEIVFRDQFNDSRYRAAIRATLDE